MNLAGARWKRKWIPGSTWNSNSIASSSVETVSFFQFFNRKVINYIFYLALKWQESNDDKNSKHIYLYIKSITWPNLRTFVFLNLSNIRTLSYILLYIIIYYYTYYTELPHWKYSRKSVIHVHPCKEANSKRKSPKT